MNVLQRVSKSLVAISVGAASCLVLAEPAAAATPVCSTYRNLSGYLAPTSSAGSRSCWLQRGHKGDGVVVLQTILDICYGDYLDYIGFPYKVENDGDFGPITREALRQVQKAEGIDADGVYGPVTAHTIMIVGTNKPCNYVNYV
ncbi:peptidoglycan-binding domain-containing protein [Dactylosporangium sp. NPDC050588]|uniref:peptidoglycan-binding domain-containing protein n=1 Tax=Dactylosporangium sp. NPDC050588 TaxID=3157211 RepID=UPI0033CD7D11